MSKIKRILFLGNSQGTAAGLDGADFWLNYPHLIQKKLKNINCIYWVTSDNSLARIDNLFRETIKQHQPELVILQCGIIEAGLRILPRKIKDFLKCFWLGRGLTFVIHQNQQKWLKLLQFLGLYFFESSPHDVAEQLQSIINKCRENKINNLIFISLPLLSNNRLRKVTPNNNRFIVHYNEILAQVTQKNHIPVVNPFLGNRDKTLNSLYLSDTVHFSVAGHRLIAKNILESLKANFNL